jgi:uncharacterized protein (DUF934 family)
MPLLKNNSFINDTWLLLDDEATVEDGAKVIVSFARLQRDWDSLARHTGLLAVTVPNTARASELVPFFSKLAMIVLAFPAFTDGRSYSLSRQLRTDGYRGELRAQGNILPDQLQLMMQVGIDSFDVPDRFPLEAWQHAASLMSLTYQRGLARPGNEREVWSQRHEGFAAWEEQPHAG